MELITQKMTLGELEFDFPTTTEAAVGEAVADLLKSPSAPWRAKEDIPFWRKFFVGEKIETANLLPGQVKHWISTDAIDRDGESMLPKGADLKYYRKNGMVLWGHDYSQPENVIAKNKWIQTEDHGLIALTEFARHQKASLVYDLYKDDFLKAWSVGFIPVKGNRPKDTGPELDLPEGVFAMDFRQPEFGSLKYTHTKWILLEYSAVAVPANQEALTIAVGKGMKLSSKLMEELHINVKDIIAEAKDKAPSVVKVFDLKGKVHEKEKEQGGGEAKEEAPAQGAVGGIVTVQPVLAGEDPHETVVPKDMTGAGRTKASDLQGNPSFADIQHAVSRGLNGDLSYDSSNYRWLCELYPTDYPSGHAICQGKGGKCFQFDYTFDGEEATLGTEFTPVEMTWKPEKPGKSAERMIATINVEDLAAFKSLHAEIAELKTGRVLSAKNEKLVRDAITALDSAKGVLGDVLAALEPAPDAPKTLDLSELTKTEIIIPDELVGIDLGSIFDKSVDKS